MNASLRRPPGPNAPFWGIPLLRQMSRDYLGFSERLLAEHGDVVHMKFGKEHCYELFHPELIRQALVEHSKNIVRWERGIEVFEQVHGQSVLVTEGETWQRQRRMLQPGFGPKRMAGYARRMVAAASHALDSLPDRNDQVLDFEHAMTLLTMDVIMRTLFSSDAHQDALVAEQAVGVITRVGMEEMFWAFTLPDWMPHKSRKRWAKRTLDELIWRHIRERRAAPGARQGDGGDDDLLAMLTGIRDEEGDGRGLSDTEVRDQCMTIFLAGHETTAAALTWWGWAMASNPECARRATEEVDRVLGARLPTHEDVPSLTYLTQTLKEAMRLYPPAPALMSRRLTAPMRLGEWQVPAGAMLRITTWVMQRDPRWFDNPTRFDPDRFSPEGLARQVRGSYMPFGVGPRVCIGSIFAMTEMTLVAAMLLQRHSLHPAGAGVPTPRVNVTLRPAEGMPLRLVRRTGTG